MSWPCLGLRLLLLLAGAPGEPEEKKPVPVPVPVYTNDDLDRVSPHKDETGVSSSVQAPTPPAAATRHAAEDGRPKSEAYWRREADRLHARMQAARERIDDLRARIEEREARSPGRPRSRGTAATTEAQLATWRRRLAALEARVHEEEARFQDRARREGALPGWVR